MPLDCECECHKKEKMAIYNIYFALEKMGQDLNIERFGDVFSWYYGDQVSKEPFEISTSPKVNPDIASEIETFEKAVLKDLR